MSRSPSLVGVGTTPSSAWIDSRPATTIAAARLAAGFLPRLWATFHFYRRMKVIAFAADAVTTGPYHYRIRSASAATCSCSWGGAGAGDVVRLAITVAHPALGGPDDPREERRLGTVGDGIFIISRSALI